MANSTISIGFKLNGDLKSFKEMARDANGLKAALASTASEASTLPARMDFGKLAKTMAPVLAGVTALGTAVGKFAGDAVNMTQTWGDRWAAVQMGVSSSYQVFVRQLASGEGWDNLLSNMSTAYTVGKELAGVFDELFERNVSLKYSEAELNKYISEQTLIMRDSSKSYAEQEQAARNIIAAEKELAALKKEVLAQEAEANRARFKLQTGLDDSQLDALVRDYNKNREVIQQARAYMAERQRLENEAKAASRSAATARGTAGSIDLTQVGKGNAAKSAISDLDKATSATVKHFAQLLAMYDKGNDELVTSFANVDVALINVDTEANRASTRAVSRIGTITNKLDGAAAKAKEAKDAMLEFYRADSQELSEIAAEDAALDAAWTQAYEAWQKTHSMTPSLPFDNDTIAAFNKAAQSGNALLGGKSNLDNSISAVSSLAGAFGTLSGAISETAGSWMSWISNLLAGVATAVPAIMTLIAAHKAKTLAASADAVAEGSAAVAGVPLVGPGLAIAAAATIAATIIATIASIPKFAKGGIAFGPTVGLFGEYSGASNNPEVVAPLDRLRSLMFGGSGSMPEVIELRARGTDLVGIVNLTNRKLRRG